MGKFIKANRKEAFDIGLKLREVTTQDGEYVTYADGWDDARVAREVAPRLVADHVARIRLELFGTIRAKASTPKTELEDLRDLLTRAVETVNEHSRTIAELRAEMSRLQDTVTALTNDVATLRSQAPRSPGGFRPLSDSSPTLQPAAGEGVA